MYQTTNMATPIMSGTFDVWLTEKLTSVSPDIDTDVFVSYIIGILDENADEDTEESIVELLSGVVEPDEASKATKSILCQWDATKHERTSAEEETDMGDKLSEMLGKQTLATVQEKKLTKEEAERKAAILAQYSQVSDGEETDEEDEPPVTAASSDDNPVHHHHQPASHTAGSVAKSKVEAKDPLLVRNVNKEEVNKAEREKREKAKEEGEKKKEKDKLDRQAQKQKQQDRKDAEKKRTQKGEKRR
ncbi:coiled-coil domain-containing protein 43 [Elysia marginata]|uniref:Coiled-coil domain-containing protein 43 n=1 Tax=Elysia marginata TaxID=1093978 RepID=A0AAV4IW24_9GAST|nr:coiled-coil domain-containing protein 43 [Elysia marginata]